MSERTWNDRVEGSGAHRNGGYRALRRGLTAAVATTLAVALAACDDDTPTEPGNGEQGSMETFVRDDGGGGAGADGGPEPVTLELASENGNEVSGEFRADARIEVQVDGAWETVGQLADLEVEAELRGGERSMGAASVEAGTYDGIRIVLIGAEADVDAGSHIGVGPIEVGVTISIAGGDEVVVEHAAPFTVQADAATEVTLDVNSRLWLDEGAVDSGVVAEGEFEGAAGVTVQ